MTKKTQEAEAEVASHELFGKWLPIETAPLDREILLLERGVIHHATHGGNFHRTFKTVGHLGFVDYATHWMPLPSQPNDQSSVTGEASS